MLKPYLLPGERLFFDGIARRWVIVPHDYKGTALDLALWEWASLPWWKRAWELMRP